MRCAGVARREWNGRHAVRGGWIISVSVVWGYSHIFIHQTPDFTHAPGRHIMYLRDQYNRSRTSYGLQAPISLKNNQGQVVLYHRLENVITGKISGGLHDINEALCTALTGKVRTNLIFILKKDKLTEISGVVKSICITR